MQVVIIMANISNFYVHRALFYLFFLYTAYALVCPDNEVEVTCPTPCPSDTCPTGQVLFCPASKTDICRASACKCGFNFSRAKNGTCIPTRECPPFRCPNVHEEYNPCPPACPSDDCSQATPTGRCPVIGRIGIVVPCKPACRCKKNYWRKDGICVPYARCNRKNTSSIAILQCLKRNESLKCVKDCPPERTCSNKDIKFNCLQDNKRCQIKCVCNPNFYRNIIGECVPAEMCDRCPGPNEYFNCGGACDNVCADLHTQNQTNCPIINIKCNDMCYCRSDYARNEKNICVPIGKCKFSSGQVTSTFTYTDTDSKGAKAYSYAHASSGFSGCGTNEIYQRCKKSCPPDTCISLVAKFKCDSEELCTSGCTCKPGFLRKSSKGPCTPIGECPQLANSPDFN